MFRELDARITRAIKRFRMGYYAAVNAQYTDSFRRQQINPHWCDDPIDKVLSVHCPIMDIVSPSGTNSAVIARNGVTSYPLAIGTVYDETFNTTHQTVWIKANLDSEPGKLEIGATKQAHLFAGTKAGEKDWKYTQGGSRVSVFEGGKIEIKNEAVSLIPEIVAFADEVETLIVALDTYASSMAAASTGVLSPLAAPPGVLKGVTTATKQTIFALRKRLEKLT